MNSRERVLAAIEHRRPDIVNGAGRGRGMEQVLLDIMTEDPVGVAIIDKRCDYYPEVTRRTLEAGRGGIDILCLGEDTGNQNGPMFDPAVFDAFSGRVFSDSWTWGMISGAR